LTTSQGNTLEKTEVLYGLDDIMKKSIQFLSQAHKIDLCGDNRSANAILDIEEYKKILSEVKSKGIETRYVTEINKDNINNCKQLMDFVGEVRHLDGIRANFSISETEYLASIAEIQTAKLVPHIIYSNVKYIVEEQKYVFESFWNKAIPAEQRIREIEEGIESEFFEVIAERKKISQIFLDLVRSVKKEALILFPNDKAMVRAYRLGIIDYLVKVSQKQNGVSTKIICPLSKENYSIVKKISEQAPSVRILNGNDSLYGMYILDSEKLLRVEMREPKAETFIEAIGFAMYSNRKNTVESFRSVFELIWNEHVLNEELKKTYERQEEFIKMQQEFLNIASHEMKTPTQAILAISRLLQKHPERKDEFIQAISRNAVRLQRLTNDILDVTRIESQTLKLKKERFDLNDIILNIVQDYRNQLEKDKDKRNVKLLLFYDQEFNKNNNYNDDKSPIFIEADRERIGQVISNLLSNAIKFSKKMAEDYISIATIPSNEGDQVIVSVKDTGIGIDSQILPRLFEKFVTKSDAGTGLGLFISKSIVEAHGGRIWAENNKDGGATFYFSLPLKKTRAQSSNNNEQ
jgi:two-component system, OmpR family, sensor histidine kinase VicK